MSPSFANLGRQLLASRTLLGRRPVQISIAVGIAVTLLSIILAPDTSPTTWDWVRIVLIGILGTVAVLTFAMAQPDSIDSTDRQQRLLASGVLIVAAIILNLTFTIGTTLIFSVGITIVALIAGSDRDLRSSWLITGALVAAIPFWVWSALEAWTWGLLLLVPLAAIGVISDGHMRTATGITPDPEPLLSRRGHRLASWAGILGSALLALGLGLLTDASNGVVAMGAVGAMILVALEAGSPSSPSTSPRTSTAIADAALLWVALCWIVSL